MKRFLALLLSIVSVFACFSGAGCQKGLTAEQKKNALIVEYYKAGYGEIWIQNLASEFTKRTGQEVVLLPRSGQSGVQSMAASSKSGTSQTDLYFTNGISLSDIYRGAAIVGGKTYDTWYADLTDVYNTTIEGENVKIKDKMYDSHEEYFRMPDDGKYYANKYYGMPWFTGMQGIIVNMDVWNNVSNGRNLPRTTDELLELCDSVKGQTAPFIYSLGDEYFTAYFQMFMWQYEGNARMDKFYQGYGPNQEDRYDTNMIAYIGMEKSLEFFEKLLAPERGLMHKDSASLTFMQMQGSFLSGAALFCINGDWLEREMITKYPNANIAMMKAPVLSAIADKCTFKNEQNRDEILRSAIDYVDGKDGATKPAKCTDGDIAYIREARAMELVSAGGCAFVPVYSNQIESAKNFLRFMYTDEGMRIFRDGANGCEMPFNYTNPVANPNETVFRKSINDALAVSQARFVNGKDRIFTLGGINIHFYNNSIGRFVKAFTSTGESRKTAKQYFNAEVQAVNDMLNDAKRQAGIL